MLNSFPIGLLKTTHPEVLFPLMGLEIGTHLECTYWKYCAGREKAACSDYGSEISSG